MVVVTICYREGVDVEYYLSHHVPRSVELMTPLGVLRAETRRLIAGADGSKPPYVIITSLYFESLEAFQTCMAHPDLEELREDANNFYTGMPEIFVGDLLLEEKYA